jgi:hypothetical protein
MRIGVISNANLSGGNPPANRQVYLMDLLSGTLTQVGPGAAALTCN